MRLIDALHAPWAIRPETLDTMLEVYERNKAGEVLDVKAIEAAIGKPLNNDPLPYEVIDGVAVINCVGVLGKRFDLFTMICGGASTQRLQDELQAALNDPTVHSIVLSIDSPGGEVDGTQALATDVFNARDQKPIVALIDGMGASAAYWIASAASRVYVTGDTAVVGSIGVVMGHTDVSKAQEMRGVRTTEITAGKYKRIASSYAPLTPEGRQSLQDVVDHIYSVFVDDVARNRNVSVDAVLKDMADGRLFLGEQAISAGLVDGMSTLSALIETLNTDRTAAQFQTGASAPNSKPGENTTMTETAKTHTQADVDEAFNRGKAEGNTEGATAERARIQDVEAQTLPNHEALIASMKFDGKTTGPEAAVAVLKAERERKAKVGTDVSDLTADAPNKVPNAAAPDADAKTEPEAQVIADKAKAYQVEQKKAGKDVGVSDAVAHVRAELGLSK
jgi:signal peptide peptidase SppA